jgi:hypothetical protein
MGLEPPWRFAPCCLGLRWNIEDHNRFGKELLGPGRTYVLGDSGAPWWYAVGCAQLWWVALVAASVIVPLAGRVRVVGTHARPKRSRPARDTAIHGRGGACKGLPHLAASAHRRIHSQYRSLPAPSRKGSVRC